MQKNSWKLLCLNLSVFPKQKGNSFHQLTCLETNKKCQPHWQVSPLLKPTGRTSTLFFSSCKHDFCLWVNIPQKSKEEKTYSKLPPPRTAGLLIRKTLTGVLWEGSHTWKSRVPGFQKIFTAEFGHFLVTIFFYKFFFKKIIKKKQVTKKWPNSSVKKNPGYRDFKSRYWKKILDTGISNPSTGNRIYNRENFRALRAHPKPSPAS